MVVTAEEDIAFIQFQIIVECLDALEVEVVGGGIEDKAVGILQLHAGNHATHLLATGEDIGFLQDLLTTEEHTAKETLEVHFVAFAKLAEPIYKVEVGVEEFSIVEGQVGGGDGYSPIELAGMGLAVAIDNLEKAVMARGSRLRNTILSPFSTLRFTSLKSTVPSSISARRPLTSKI